MRVEIMGDKGDSQAEAEAETLGSAESPVRTAEGLGQSGATRSKKTLWGSKWGDWGKWARRVEEGRLERREETGTREDRPRKVRGREGRAENIGESMEMRKAERLVGREDRLRESGQPEATRPGKSRQAEAGKRQEWERRMVKTGRM